MSFGYAVGDVIAVLGLFERIAIELRNYKDAPNHFQQLRAELDLVHSTLRHVLRLEPECEEERQTLEQIRATVIHCSQPLQLMADKMRSKEGSLGHFKTTRSLSNIGTRLHWSMIARSDVDSLRQTIMSQMAAINILLSVQQLTRVKQLSLQSQSIGTFQSLVIEKHANAIASHTSNILSIATKTQNAIDALTAKTASQTKAEAKQAEALDQNLAAIEHNMLALTRKTGKASAMIRRQAALVTHHAQSLFRLMQDMRELFTMLAKCSREMLEAISRNTRMLLDISGPLKRIMRAIEAIPLHLTLAIVRLDDAYGESWALPMQACTTWESFFDILQCVVYAGDRPSLEYIMQSRFAVFHANTGAIINPRDWEHVIRPGLHINQAIVLKILQRGQSWVISEWVDTFTYPDGFCEQCITSSHISIFTIVEATEAIGTLRKVFIVYPFNPIQDLDDAYKRLERTLDDIFGNAFFG